MRPPYSSVQFGIIGRDSYLRGAYSRAYSLCVQFCTLLYAWGEIHIWNRAYSRAYTCTPGAYEHPPPFRGWCVRLYAGRWQDVGIGSCFAKETGHQVKVGG